MLIDQPCGRCGRFSLPPAEKLSAHGFGRCTQLPAWQTRSTSAPCTFAPSRHEGRKT